MNISELARRLKVNPNQLREMLPQMGFDIGGKAIKIDNRTAHNIINNWRRLYKIWEMKHKQKEEEDELPQIPEGEKNDIRIPRFITVKDFAARINTPVNILMKLLMKNGILASLNDNIDFDSAMIIGDDLGWKVLPQEEDADIDTGSEEKVEQAVKASGDLAARAPVIVVMGHVDHGKTKILDAIRQTHIMEGEAGGITQHIGAYQVEKNGREITFIDTPGHEAFTAMRSRGAKIADIAIIVVAADDGVQPQTREVVDIVTAARIPFVVAINKMDKPEAEPERVKRELAELNLIPEDWGGKVICAPVSAKTGEGISDLLDTILLVADMEKENIVADAKGETVSSVIESHMDKNAGVVATVLVQNGTLRINDYLKIGNTLYGRVRSMENWKGEKLASAGPSVPVKILGLKLAPEVGDVLTATNDTKGLEKNLKKTASGRPTSLAYDFKPQEEDKGNKKILKVIVKGDVLGSVEAILGSIEQFHHPKLGIRVIHHGLGNITEADVSRAASSGAVLYGFNVRIDNITEDLARDKEVEVCIFEIIYDLLDDVKEKLENMLSGEMVRKDLGKIKILAIFKRSKDTQIVGGKIKEGKIFDKTKFDLMRANVKIDTGEIIGIQAGKQDVSEAPEGTECGLSVKSRQEINEGDILLVYKEERATEKVEIKK